MLHNPTGLDSIPLAGPIITSPDTRHAHGAASTSCHVSKQSRVAPGSYTSDEESIGSSEDTKLRDIGTEMQSLMTTIRQSLSSARKNKAQKKRPSSSIVKKVPGTSVNNHTSITKPN